MKNILHVEGAAVVKEAAADAAAAIAAVGMTEQEHLRVAGTSRATAAARRAT